MDLEITGKKAIVTGSTAGIGFAIAQRLAAEGAEVVISGRTRERVEAACQQIHDAVGGVRPSGVAADLGTEEGVRALVEAVPEADILVNNVGIFTVRPFAEIRRDEWRTMFETNVVSGAALSQHHLPRMLEKNAGRIVFISSESAVQIPTEMIHYGISKSAQAALARGMAEMTRGTRVTVNSVLAGPTRSEGVGTFLKELAAAGKKSDAEVEKEFFDTARPTSLVRRFLTSEEIADVVAFLVSARGAAVSGAAVRAEGGLLKTVF